jgi:glycosyltransferase involved in cell wall biosynthesis
MRVAVVTAFPPSKVTLNEYGYHLVKNFVQNDEVSELILMSDKTNEPKQLDFDKKEKIKVKDCWEFNSYTTFLSVIKAARQEKPDVILFNLQFMKFGDKKIPSALGLLLPMSLRLLGFKTVVLLHNILEQVDLEKAGFTDSKTMRNIYNFIGTNITRCLLKANKVAVTINKYVDVLNAKYHSKNVILIPHGTFESIKEPSYETKPGARQIMTFGKFGTYKKVEILIEAIEIVRKTNSEPLEVIIAGTDSPNTPGYLDSVKEKYKEVKGVIFTGYVEENDVERIFTDSTIVVFPYTSTTGSSGVLHQAGSYGKAVIMPDLGDLALLVKDEGYRGEFFNPESAESLATAINKILSNDDYRKEIAKANFEAASDLSMDKIITMYMNCFKSIK